MAQIPEVTPSGTPAPQPAGGIARAQPSSLRAAGIPGQFLQHAGGELQTAGDIINRTNLHYDTLGAEDAINQLHEKSIDLERNPQSGFRNVQGSGAIGQQFFDDYTGRLKDAAKSIAENLPNDQQRQLFIQRTPVLANQFRAQLLSHQAQETEKFAANTESNTVKLELGSIAANPDNDILMQTSLARINGVLDQRAARTNQPPAEIAEARQQILAAAWGSRIHAMMDRNPYTAEKMLEDHREDLGMSGVPLARDVHKMVQQVQARDVAQQLIFGREQPYAPDQIAPGTQGARPLESIVKGMESGGQRYDKDGNLLTSKAGAKGEFQVMGYTARDPGFGVKPAQDDSPEELARVGRDYLGAMTARYNNPALVLAAYNAGPGKVDEWLAKYGDPRSGQVSTREWTDRIPFAETKDYVQRGLQKVNAEQPQGPIYSGPTAKELKTQLPGIVDRARAVASQMYPNDPIFADAVASRVATYGQTVISGWTAQQDAARDMLTRGLTGTQPDGSDKPKSMDELIADPRMAEAWRNATPEVQLAMQNHFKNGGDQQRTPESMATMYQLLGEAQNNRQGFADRDLSDLIGKMPNSDVMHIWELQARARNRTDLDAEKQANMIHAMSVANDYALRQIKLAPPTKDTPKDQREQYDQFTGAYTQAIEQFTTVNKRPPKDDELIQMARNLTTTVTQPGKWFGTNDLRAFQITPENVGQVRPKVIPPAFLQGIVPALTRANNGTPPTQAQIDTAYMLSLRQPPKAHGRQPQPTQPTQPTQQPAPTYAFPQNAVAGTIKQ